MMTRTLVRPILGVCLAIAITTTMDATGLLAFSALPLFPLMVLFWFWERFSRSDVGFVWGAPRAYLLAMLYPLAVIGAIWGLMRWISGSVFVSSVSHGLWNGMAYVLFGFGKKVGALGVANTALLGPEVGVLGLALNVVFAAALFLWWRRAQQLAA